MAVKFTLKTLLNGSERQVSRSEDICNHRYLEAIKLSDFSKRCQGLTTPKFVR